MPNKPKKTQHESPEEVQGRDLFYTPHIATDIIAPYIPTLKVWECAAGDGAISNRLTEKWKKLVYTSDINGKFTYINFLTGKNEFKDDNISIVTNPPFSLKEKFVRKCLEYGYPFALLIPLDYSSWMCEVIEKYGCEKLIPNKRLSLITPNTVNRVNEKFGTEYTDYHDIPSWQIAKVSSAQFHIGWITYKFKFGKSETFVNITPEQIKNGIV